MLSTERARPRAASRPRRGVLRRGGVAIVVEPVDSQKGSTYFALNTKFDMKFNHWSPDKQSGCGAITVTEDRAVYALNFYVWAVNTKGKTRWKSVNKKGGLYPGSGRGIGYINYLGYRKSYPELLVADDTHAHLATKNGADVVTVLEMAKGKYVRTVDVSGPIVALALVEGGGLVVATTPRCASRRGSGHGVRGAALASAERGADGTDGERNDPQARGPPLVYAARGRQTFEASTPGDALCRSSRSSSSPC